MAYAQLPVAVRNVLAATDDDVTIGSNATVQGNLTVDGTIIGSLSTETLLPSWSVPPAINTASGFGSANTTGLYGHSIPALNLGLLPRIGVWVGTISANNHDLGLYDQAGALIAHTGAIQLPTAGFQLFDFIVSDPGVPMKLLAGLYWFALTKNGGSGALGYNSASSGQQINGPYIYSSADPATGGTTTGGVLNTTITIPNAGVWANGPSASRYYMFGLFTTD